MIFFPAIDLKDGQCVRLLRGEMDSATVFNEDPAGQARSFEAAGCRWLHVVDLNGAFAGRPINGVAVDMILDAIRIPVQLGGGIRDIKTIAGWLELGVTRVILGTVAVRDPALVREACSTFPGRVAVGIDHRDGRVAVEGWSEVSETTALELAKRLEDAGASSIIYTDISRDGTMEGPNVEATVALAKAVSTPVIASGGVSSMDDLVALKRAGEGIIEGVICGRAIYDRQVDPAAAIALLDDERPREQQ
jgi:phosphoribosylformimino-5-aminoimidazole carboxamide ribotide isomerase